MENNNQGGTWLTYIYLAVKTVCVCCHKGCVLFQLAQIALSNLRKCSDRSDKSAKRTHQITLLFGHAHTTHNAVEYINVYVNIYDVAVVGPITVVIADQLFLLKHRKNPSKCEICRSENVNMQVGGLI